MEIMVLHPYLPGLLIMNLALEKEVLDFLCSVHTKIRSTDKRFKRSAS